MKNAPFVPKMRHSCQKCILCHSPDTQAKGLEIRFFLCKMKPSQTQKRGDKEMAFGYKIRKLETSKEYSMEELFEAIKDKQFTAGQPELTKHGPALIITFPPIDRNNQIWISPGQMKKAPWSKFTVTKNEVAGLDNSAKNLALSAVTRGWSDVSGVFGKKAKTAEALVVTTHEELQALGL